MLGNQNKKKALIRYSVHVMNILPAGVYGESDVVDEPEEKPRSKQTQNVERPDEFLNFAQRQQMPNSSALTALVGVIVDKYLAASCRGQSQVGEFGHSGGPNDCSDVDVDDTDIVVVGVDERDDVKS